MVKESAPKVVVHNVNVPGWTGKVDQAKYEAMKKALLKVVPKAAPGITQTEMRNKVVLHLPDALFPGGEKADWWSKCVQLDLEYEGILVRERDQKPLRWHKA